MRVFVNNVDLPLGVAVSKLLSNTIVGSRREEGEGAEDNASDAGAAPPAAGTEEATGENAVPAPAKREPYEVFGSLSNAVFQVNDTLAQVAQEQQSQPPVVPNDPTSALDAAVAAGDVQAIQALQDKPIPTKPEWVKNVVTTGSKQDLKKALIESDIIIYDIANTNCVPEATWAIETLAASVEEYADRPKLFLLISTVMTWAKTKFDHDDPEAVLTEDEYRRRKPHPNYKEHMDLEKLVIKLGKKAPLKGYVVASGLIYHAGESIFHHLFKAAWQGAPELLCYGDGTNVLPMIHLDDLSNIVTEVVETSPEVRYILAVDDAKSTLYDVIKTISDQLGSGTVRKITKEETLLLKDLPQSDYDQLQVNLRLEAGSIKDMSFEWKSESGLMDNLPTLIQDYKEQRGLKPVKILFHGPPTSGKTFYAQKIAKEYQLHYLHAETVATEAIAKLERLVTHNSAPSGETDSAGGADEEEQRERARELLDEVREAAGKANGGPCAPQHVAEFVRQKLRSMPCHNQGYVLDGYPSNLEEIGLLFQTVIQDDEKHDEKGAEDNMLPEFVISLQLSDDAIKQRAMRLPEVEPTAASGNAATVANGGRTAAEEHLLKRLELYRAQNTDDNTPLNFFDEREIHPLIVPLDQLHEDSEAVLQRLRHFIGPPRNYGPTPAERLARLRQEYEQRQQREREQQADQQRRAQEEATRQAKLVADWTTRLEEVRRQEKDVLEAQSVPLRQYLMRHVMPTLTTALIQVCKVRPEDPIDYLAEYLFKQNPTNAV